MWEESTDQHCEECGQEKKPRKLVLDVRKKSSSTLDRVRGFVSDTIGSDTSADSETEESKIGRKEKIFYLCPDLSCDGREGDVRKMERWRMKTSIKREFSEEKLDEIVSETVEQEKSDQRIISDAVDDVHSRLLDDSTENSSDDASGDT